ncbi:hypothetical protein NEOKW01_2096 [Nematocida sp. AWRm80]|nr:hypothetical protein NEOKW01_2096 [Nematocida sp. AWRm80]
MLLKRTYALNVFTNDLFYILTAYQENATISSNLNQDPSIKDTKKSIPNMALLSYLKLAFLSSFTAFIFAVSSLYIFQAVFEMPIIIINSGNPIGSEIMQYICLAVLVLFVIYYLIKLAYSIKVLFSKFARKKTDINNTNQYASKMTFIAVIGVLVAASSALFGLFVPTALFYALFKTLLTHISVAHLNMYYRIGFTIILALVFFYNLHSMKEDKNRTRKQKIIAYIPVLLFLIFVISCSIVEIHTYWDAFMGNTLTV